MNIDRLPPHSPEAEQGVLGCAMLSPSEVINGLMIRGFRHDDFYDLRHQLVFRHLVAMFTERNPIDAITIKQRLKDAGELEQVGGIDYLGTLQDATPSAANASYYTDIVEGKSVLRKALQFATLKVDAIYENNGDVQRFLDEWEQDALAIRRNVSERVTINKIVQEATANIEERFNLDGAIAGLATGFPDYDNATQGMRGGDLIIPAALPSVGKTTWAMNVIEHVAVNLGIPAGVFSLEMRRSKIVERMIASLSRVNLKYPRSIEDTKVPAITMWAGRIAKSPLHIVDDMFTASKIRAEARRMVAEHGVKVIFIDYIQLIDSEAGKGDNREREVAKAGQICKAIAMENNVPVIAPSQLNDDGQLRESRALVQHADTVMIMERQEGGTPAEYNENRVMTQPSTEPVNMWIRKQRDGDRDVCIPLILFKPYTRFEQASKIHNNDIPERHQ